MSININGVSFRPVFKGENASSAPQTPQATATTENQTEISTAAADCSKAYALGGIKSNNGMTIEEFKKAGNKFEKGKAITSDGKTYSGDLLQKAKDGTSTIDTYANGQRSNGQYINSDGTLKETYEYKYDNEGNQVELVRKDKDGSIITITNDEYLNGLNIKSTVMDKDKNITEIDEYKYDENKNKTNTLRKDKDNNIIDSTDFTYDKNGYEIGSACKDKDGKIKYTTETENNENGDHLKSIEKDGTGKIIGTTEFKYDDKGGYIGMTIKDGDGKITYQS